jgi:hypothetical protein
MRNIGRVAVIGLAVGGAVVAASVDRRFHRRPTLVAVWLRETGR